MSNLKNLLIRINSIKSTKKITRVMQMIAASKLAMAQANLHSARAFSDAVADSIGNIPCDNNDNYLSTIKEKEIIIIISSDKGLCGGYNSNLIKLADSRVSSFNDINKYFVFFGRKLYNNLRKRISQKSICFIEGERSFDNVKLVIDNLHKNYQIKSCKILYTQFKSAMSLVPVVEKIFPISEIFVRDDKKISLNGSFSFEPNHASVNEWLVKEYQYAKLYQALKEATASEYMSRMIAMDGATRNAQNVIDDLTLKYNRSRQDKITKELIEIVSGAEAL